MKSMTESLCRQGEKEEEKGNVGRKGGSGSERKGRGEEPATAFRAVQCSQ